VKLIWVILTVVLVVLLAGLGVWVLRMPPGEDAGGRVAVGPPAAPGKEALRIGLVPERDIFQLRKRYLVLTGYLAGKLGRPVEVVTVNTYQAVMQDFAERKVDAAFLGSFVAVLTVDRQNAQVLVKPVAEGGVSTYRGVLIVPEGSPVRRVADLGGRSVAMVKTTAAGDLFPIWAMHEAGLLKSAAPPRLVWVGTHDDVILETLAGRVDAGAVKNLRLDAYEATHRDMKIRRLATSDEVPNDALVVRGDLGPTLGAELRDALLAMDTDPEGVRALKGFGAIRFVPCGLDEFAAIYRMVEALGDQWERLGIDGPPPRKPAFPAGG
jgi:phosphonate transport system substrate-binding protein